MLNAAAPVAVGADPLAVMKRPRENVVPAHTVAVLDSPADNSNMGESRLRIPDVAVSYDQRSARVSNAGACLLPGTAVVVHKFISGTG